MFWECFQLEGRDSLVYDLASKYVPCASQGSRPRAHVSCPFTEKPEVG